MISDVSDCFPPVLQLENAEGQTAALGPDGEVKSVVMEILLYTDIKFVLISTMLLICFRVTYLGYKTHKPSVSIC